LIWRGVLRLQDRDWKYHWSRSNRKINKYCGGHSGPSSRRTMLLHKNSWKMDTAAVYHNASTGLLMVNLVLVVNLLSVQTNYIKRSNRTATPGYQ
jgi:hypothetical protein